MSSQEKGFSKNQVSSKSSKERELNRRKFVQKIMASLPAVGLACAVPAIAAGGEGKADEWICRTHELFSVDGFSLYVWTDCQNQEIFMRVEPSGQAFGDCGDPSEPDCEKLVQFKASEQSQDALKVFYSPELTLQQKQKFDSIKEVLLYSINFG